jgi:hypothetical protein
VYKSIQELDLPDAEDQDIKDEIIVLKQQQSHRDRD